jgi:hypothetical protein
MSRLQNAEIDSRFISLQEDFDSATNSRGSSESSRDNVTSAAGKNANWRTNVRQRANHFDRSSIATKCEDSIVIGAVRCSELSSMPGCFCLHDIESYSCFLKSIDCFVADSRASSRCGIYNQENFRYWHSP